MKVTVNFGETRVVVPCKDGWMVRDLMHQATQRYKKIVEQVTVFSPICFFTICFLLSLYSLDSLFRFGSVCLNSLKVLYIYLFISCLEKLHLPGWGGAPGLSHVTTSCQQECVGKVYELVYVTF